MAGNNPLQKFGKAKVRFNGIELSTQPGATLDIGGFQRETVMGSHAVAGFTEKPKQSRLECTVIIGRGTSAKDLNVDDISYTFEGDTGQIWSVPNAWSVDTITVDSGSGTARVTLEGPAAEEVL